MPTHIVKSTGADRTSIRQALSAFGSSPLPVAARGLFITLGYQSDRTLTFGNVSAFQATYDPNDSLADFAPLTSWNSIDLVFQLTSEDIAKGSSRQISLLEPDPADLREIKSYLFIAIDLRTADGNLRTRTELCNLARGINRLFPMPALVLFKEGERISIAITYRRANKKDASKDVVGRKVTLIRDISTTRPHPGHVAILEDFALPTLSAFRKHDIRSFADLDAAWRESLSVELLRRRAYVMLADWYFWAREHAEFPPDAVPDADGKPSLHLIRLLTRIIFCWFVKEKTLPDGRSLLPYELFDAPRIREILKDASPQASTYYTAVLQNLFFATLNTEMDEPGKPKNRRFARKVKEDHMVHTLWRHEQQLRDPAAFVALLRGVPFLNGGLFECLDDRVEIKGSKLTREIRVDGFSTDPTKHPRLPNYLFFGDEQAADLTEATGGTRATVEVAPLLTILNRFVWTITESTPLEEEVALDPDLLGNVFENLLASYNPETGIVARNATGSFYTPDYVVDWMIEQALIPLLTKALPPKVKNAERRIARLLDWNEPGHEFSAEEATSLVNSISQLRALDPACGSGAFPMGLLKKMVRVLNKLDPSNTLWKERQKILAERIDSATAREEALTAIERAFSRNNDDYGRKLYLIETSIYGVDIQPLAVQIAKLRFFITLIVDQPVDPASPNYGILPLPNLETKIVPADTLLGLQRGQLLLGSDEVRRLETELKNVRHRYFTARRYQDKKALRKRDRELCKDLAKALVESGECSPSDAARLVDWNPYNTNTHAGFFDPGWMFGLEGEGGKFDLVVGNPPYVRQEELKAVTVRDSTGQERPLKEILKEQYLCFTGTADLYVYFFERSIGLLRVGGVLSFITSNKYFRAAYGEKLRAFLLYATAPRVILDFGDTNIFTAVAYPSIIITEKIREVTELPAPKSLENEARFKQLVEHPEREFSVFAWQPGPSKVEFADVFDRQHFPLKQRELKPSGWRLESPVSLRLMERLRNGGTPLGQYCERRFYRGILTGYNDAFVVDRETKDRLIAEHSSSKEVLKPFLRGRDVKRWRCEFADQYLVKIESSENESHPWSGLAKKQAEVIFKKTYPAIHGFFNSAEHRKKLVKRYDQGKYFWELRSCAYWKEFEQPKIVAPAIQDYTSYAADAEGFYSNDKTSILIPPSVPFALAFLNSQVSWWITQQEFASKQGGFYEFKPMYVSKLPIPSATLEQKHHCESISCALIELHRSEIKTLPNGGLIVEYLEQWLNGLVYELFFPGELHSRNIHFFDATAEVNLPALDNADYLERLRAAFVHAYDLNHPLRAMLADLQTIEEVRIIEGGK